MGLSLVPRRGERARVLQLPDAGHEVLLAWSARASRWGTPGAPWGAAAVQMSQLQENTKSHRLLSRLECG